MMTEQEYNKEFEQLRKDYPDAVRFVPVADYWCPNYPDGTVKGCASIGLNFEHVYEENPKYPKYIAHISFWGYDDTGVEKWYYNDDLKKVIEVYEEYVDYLNKVPENIELQDYLFKDGFIPA